MSVLAHVLGLDDPTSYWYCFWSGIFPDVTVFAAGAIFLRRHNCHAAGCWRIGRFPVEGTAWTVCHRHHPDGAPSAEDVKGAGS